MESQQNVQKSLESVATSLESLKGLLQEQSARLQSSLESRNPNSFLESKLEEVKRDIQSVKGLFLNR